MKKLLVIIACVMLCTPALFAQKKWTLKECIDYALENNLDIKQRELASQSSELNLKTAKMSMLPNLNANVGENFSFGRSTSSSGVIVNENANSTSFGLSSSMPLFEGLRIYNQIESNKLNLKAALEDLNQVKDNTSISIASQYLQILFNKELYKIATAQVDLSTKQLERTEQLVSAGSKSNADLYESKALLAKDKLSEVESSNNVKLALLALAQLLDIRESLNSFDIAEPNVDELLKLEALSFVLSDESFDDLVKNRPDIKASTHRLEAGKKDLNIAKSAYYPNLNLQAGYGTGYYSTMLEQMLNPNSGVMPLKKQLDINQQFNVSLGLNIPIFNRMATRYSVQNAKISILSKQLELENSRKVFYNEIQQAYHNAVASGEKFMSSKEALSASEEAFRYANEKYNAGRASVYEFEESKSRLMRTNSELAQAKYEFIFRCKILDFYKGKSLEF